MIDNIDTSGLVYAAGVIFAAYVVRGIAGFGSGLIAIPLLALQYPLPIVVPIVVFLDYLGSASQAHGNQRRIVWSDLLPLIPFTLFGVVVGVFLLSTMDKVWLGRALGVFVLAYAIYQLLPLPDLKGSRLFAIPCGLAGGGIGTLFGAGGPLYVIYFNLLGIPKEGFGFSGNSKSKMGPPDYDDVRFLLLVPEKRIKVIAQYETVGREKKRIMQEKKSR